MITTNDRTKRIDARNWNKTNAEIDIKYGICRREVAEHFRTEAKEIEEQIKYAIYNYGEDSSIVKKNIDIQTFYKNIANSIDTEA